MMSGGTYFSRDNSIQAAPRIIIVEGADDAYFLDTLLSNMNVPASDVRVLLANGKDKMKNTLRPILKSHAFTSGEIERYAIIRDADENAQNAVNEVHTFLKALKEPCPPRGGFVTRTDNRIVGLYLFPDAVSNGDLETLCIATATGPLVEKASEFITNAHSGAGGHNDHFGKRHAQAYLSAGSLPLCAGVGWATTKGAFDVTHQSVDNLRDFLNNFIN